MKNKGFTLIELLVVIAIIGLLATIVMVSLNSARAKARDAKRSTELRQIKTAIELYFDQNGFYPLCSGNAVCSSTGYSGDIKTLSITNYIAQIPTDPTNVNGSYGYYYARGYKKTGASSFANTGLSTDYILATRLENSAGTFSGWNNGNLNLLLGN